MSEVLLVPPPAPGGTRPALVLFPYAGSGVAPFRGWAADLADLADVTGVLLPGREQLFGQPTLQSMAEVLARVVPMIEELAPRPVVLFGHSMGATVAFAVARELRRRAVAAPHAVIVSGAGSPDRRDPTEQVHLFDDAALIAHTVDYGGIHPDLLANPEMLKLFVPVLRADFRILETWPVRPEPPLDPPLTVLRGLGDASVTDYQAAGWRALAADPPAEYLLPGGHFFVHTARSEVLAIVRGVLGAVGCRPGTWQPATDPPTR